MSTKCIAKFLIAVALTIATIVGSGVVTEQIGLDSTPTAYACNGSGGGGC
jgi:hypothetical protein